MSIEQGALLKLLEIAGKVDKIGKKAITKETSKIFREALFSLDEEYEELYKTLNRKFSVLMLGDRYSIFLRKLIRNLKLFLGDSITIYVMGVDSSKGSYSKINFNLYEDIYVPILFNSSINSSLLKPLRKVRNFFTLRKAFSETTPFSKFDLINIHYLHYFWAFVSNFMKENKIVTTIWGSDMYRSAMNSNIAKSLQMRVLKISMLITAGNPQLKNDFLKTYGNEFKDKIRIAAFGTPIDLLEHNILTNENIESFKKRFKIPNDKKIVVVGSSADPLEYHVEILSALKKFKDEIFVIIPMTYGDLKYRDTIERFFSESDLKGVILKTFLTDSEMATLKKISDIVIYLPKTDAFSAFLQESLYAGTVVITGKWLPYDWMDELGIYCRRIERPESEMISKAVEQVLEHLDGEKEKSSFNRERILKLSAWQYRFKDWLKVYAEALNKD